MINLESIDYLSDVGNKGKQGNYIWPVPGLANANDKVFIVCEGSGSFDNGGIASKLICQFMAAKVLKFGESKMSGELITKLLIEARDRLIFYAQQCRLDTDMATSFSILILYDQRVFMSWCGDSRIYHLREGQILFRTDANSLTIKADSSAINVETKWIEDVHNGDYFLLCSKGLSENVTDDDIKSLLSQNDKANSDLANSFKQLAVEKKPDNYSMYLIRANLDTQKSFIKNVIFAGKNQTRGMMTPIFIAMTAIIGLLIIFYYFQYGRTSDSAQKYTNQTNQPMYFLREDSITGATMLLNPLKPIATLKDSVKNNSEYPRPVQQNSNLTNIQTGDKPEQTNLTFISQKKPIVQLLIKLTTIESCKLKIKNINLDEVIDWDLAQNDNSTIYLNPGTYSIVATSVIDNNKTKTFNFDVKPGYVNTIRSLHITF